MIASAFAPSRTRRLKRYARRQPGKSTAMGMGGLLLVGLLVMAGIHFGPDVIRYLKIERM